MNIEPLKMHKTLKIEGMCAINILNTERYSHAIDNH